MAEQLLTANQVAKRLGISRRTFYRRRLELLRRGLQERIVGPSTRYREVTLDRLIEAGDEATAVVVR